MAATATTGLPIEFQVKDYREFTGKVDHVVSMGMFEHVGYKNYRAYFQAARRAISDNGLFMLHTIGSQWPTRTIDPWIEKYIFPGGVIPSMGQIGTAIDGLFAVIDVHNIGPHYDKTLMAWYENFEKNWPRSATPKASASSACGNTTCSAAPAASAPARCRSGSSSCPPGGVPEGYVTQR